MKKLIVAVAFMLAGTSAFADTQMCEVRVCNQLKRFSLDPFAHLKDRIGRTCFNVQLPKSESVVGRELSSESRWYQGSFNPTKKSVTFVDQVYRCSAPAPAVAAVQPMQPAVPAKPAAVVAPAAASRKAPVVVDIQ